MSEPAKIRIEAEIDVETYETMRWLLERDGRDQQNFIAEAIRRAAEQEAQFGAFIQEGIDAADRGDVLTQEEMEQWFEERIAARRVG
jgi:predicted transcriptional regulator